MKTNSHAKGPVKEGQRNQNYYPTHADYVDKLKETINEVSEENAKEYELPAATSEILGGVKIGNNITNEGGKISVPNADSNTCGVTKLYNDSG